MFNDYGFISEFKIEDELNNNVARFSAFSLCMSYNTLKKPPKFYHAGCEKVRPFLIFSPKWEGRPSTHFGILVFWRRRVPNSPPIYSGEGVGVCVWHESLPISWINLCIQAREKTLGPHKIQLSSKRFSAYDKKGYHLLGS